MGPTATTVTFKVHIYIIIITEAVVGVYMARGQVFLATRA